MKKLLLAGVVASAIVASLPLSAQQPAPGKDAQTKARIGWVAPYGRKDNPTAITAAGHGASALAAAEDAWAQFEAEFGSPPGTSE